MEILKLNLDLLIQNKKKKISISSLIKLTEAEVEPDFEEEIYSWHGMASEVEVPTEVNEPAKVTFQIILLSLIKIRFFAQSII